MKVSIIVVNYKVKPHVIECIRSIISSKPRFSYEILLVDNDEKKTLSKTLRSKFPIVKYVPNRNRGFGQGNNIGASKAVGKYLFFLNPDTKVLPRAIDNLVHFLDENKKVGIVAPLLLDPKENAYELQGTETLTPGKAVFAYSFLNKLLPNNSVSRKFWMKEWDKTKVKEVEVVPGTAFMIRSEIYKRVGGFDEKFFLYFEEYDLCKRVKETGYKIFIEPSAKVIHFWGESTKKSRLDINNIFKKSRFYYFKKHFGLLQTVLVTFVFKINKINTIVFLVLLGGLFLRLHNIKEEMSFIGDFAWFYISAKEMILTGNIPLVGITSSHTWLHQGPLWTYIVAIFLIIFKFNPFPPVYFSIFLDVVTAYLLFKLGSHMFGERAGVISAYIYSVSPLFVTFSRFPYHISPIPLLVLLFFYFLYELVSENKTIMFPAIIFILGLLYNFELSTAVLWPVFILVIGYGLFKKETYTKNLFSKKILVLSLISFLISMFPILIYDFINGFPQTAGFMAWIIYSVIKFIGFFPAKNIADQESINSLIEFGAYKLTYAVFPLSFLVTFTILISSLLISFYLMIKSRIKQNGYKLLVLYITIATAGFLAGKSASNAYLPVFFPFIMLLVGVLFDFIMRKKIGFYIMLIVLLMIGVFNIYFLYTTQFPKDKKYGIGKIVVASSTILKDAESRNFSLKEGGNFIGMSNIINNYKYVLFWQGAKISEDASISYTIFDTSFKKFDSYIFMDDNITIVKE